MGRRGDDSGISVMTAARCRPLGVFCVVGTRGDDVCLRGDGGKSSPGACDARSKRYAYAWKRGGSHEKRRKGGSPRRLPGRRGRLRAGPRGGPFWAGARRWTRRCRRRRRRRLARPPRRAARRASLPWRRASRRARRRPPPRGRKKQRRRPTPRGKLRRLPRGAPRLSRRASGRRRAPAPRRRARRSVRRRARRRPRRSAAQTARQGGRGRACRPRPPPSSRTRRARPSPWMPQQLPAPCPPRPRPGAPCCSAAAARRAASAPARRPLRPPRCRTLAVKNATAAHLPSRRARAAQRARLGSPAPRRRSRLQIKGRAARAFRPNKTT
mmetsp:Transcript_16704/g.57156  ORF Transcript_16704/g.57156 Transcript_16704/m.57156 type:complete len:326 (+) Transcript_16704:101-1078(+)